MSYLEMNRVAWDHRAKVHLASKMYDLPGFLDGKSSLKSIELEEMSDVSGKSLLHLQCHFGLDTLSWARKGAKVTGVDLSPQAIKQAQNLAKQINLDAKFICANIYDFAKENSILHDIVFTSYGAICWLPDINLWAESVYSSLKKMVHFIWLSSILIMIYTLVTRISTKKKLI